MNSQLILLPKEKVEKQREKTSSKGQVPKIVGVKDKPVMQLERSNQMYTKKRLSH